MEISKERVKSPGYVDDEYLCPICYNLLCNPVECQNCQRLFCKQCIDKCLKEKPGICPLCEHYQEKRCSPMFYALLCKFKIECENKHNGCNDILLYELVKKHQEEQCQYQMKTCRGCQTNVLKKDVEQHEQKCGDITITCNRCKLVYKQKEKHEQLDCLMTMLEQNNKKVESLEQNVRELERRNERSQQFIEQNNKKVESLEQNVRELEAKNERSQQFIDQIKQEIRWNNESGDSSFFASIRLSLISESGVIHDLSLSLLSHQWSIIYDFPYSHATTVEELRALRSRCKKRIIVGAIQGNSSTILKLAALGPSEILSLDSPRNQPTKYGNIHWYLTPKISFGFAPSTTTINCGTADHGEKDNSENRLSWHLQGGRGWRAGAVTHLDEDNEWRKIIMTEQN